MQTSLLDLSTGLRAIDATYLVNPKLISIVNFPSGPYEWFYTDFQMVYDPCSCFFTSKMEISLALSNSSTISLTGSSSGTIVSSGSPTAAQSSKGPISLGEVATGVKKATQAYNDIYKAQQDLQDAINKEGGSKQSNRTTGLSNLILKIQKNDFLKAGLSTIPFVSDVLDIVSIFTGGGKEGPQEVTITPMTIKQSYDFTGTILNDFQNYASVTFRTPGSLTGNSPLSQYPYYNEVMGVFNLLQTPRYKRTVTNNGGGNYTATFTLSNDIEYVLNPAAKLDIQEIKIYLLVLDQNAETKSYQLSQSAPSFSIPYTHGGPTPQAKRFMVILNLKRQNTNANTQNVLLSLQYPVKLVSSIVKPTAKFKLASNVDAFCNSSTYINSARFPFSAGRYEEAVKELERKEWEEELKKQDETELPEENESFSVYPNPVATLITVDYTLTSSSSVQLILRNTAGEKTILETTSNVDAGSYSTDFDVSYLPDGLYYISIITNGNEEVQKLIIRK